MRFVFLILLVCSFYSFAEIGSKLKVGTTGSLLKSLSQLKGKTTLQYSLLSISGADIPLFVEDFYFKDGIVSLSGKAKESENSLFILKGDHNEIYGWVLFKDKNLAYEYTTDDQKNVIVQQVPTSHVFCIEDFQSEHNDYIPIVQDFHYTIKPPAPHIGIYPGTNLNKLQSLPGAKKVLYLDITRIMNGDTPISQSVGDVWNIWQSVSASFSMYEVNITTDKDIYLEAGVLNSGVAILYDTAGRSHSPVSAFGTTRPSTVFRKTNAYYTGRTCTHELGHLMGVYDAGGDPGGTYFVGFSEYKWFPIMGNFTYGTYWGDQALYQWVKGEYLSANNVAKADFLKIANKNLPYREDDIPETIPLKIDETGNVLAEINFGQITQNTDSDMFTFKIIENTGNVDLKIDRIEYIAGAMLDIDASILDASGNMLYNHNPKAKRYALINKELPKGTYTLLIKGGAEGTPQEGFSNYGSLGYYAIEGKITGCNTTEIAKKKIFNNFCNQIVSQVAGSQIKINLPKESNIDQISVYSINGKRMLYIKKRVSYLDISNFAKGVYTLNITVDAMNIVKKIIRN